MYYCCFVRILYGMFICTPLLVFLYYYKLYKINAFLFDLCLHKSIRLLGSQKKMELKVLGSFDLLQLTKFPL